jgi:hypothetical protein
LFKLDASLDLVLVHMVIVDILVAAGGIPSWTTFLRVEDSRSQRKTIEQLKNTPEKNKVK